MDERLIRIEEQIAHLERAVEVLDDVVREAFEAIAQLRRELEHMGHSTRQRLDGIVDVLERSGEEEDA